ncbi:MAG: helix-turn-helix transcriptional regulator [Symploca sp. SIO2G7]|nr:helix-turn-helix transcriptional regulator [Symploca sp. SIO2G7]
MIRFIREKSPYTQARIAEKMGVALRTWQDYEQGAIEAKFSLWQIKVLVEILEQIDLSIKDLPDPPPPPKT